MSSRVDRAESYQTLGHLLQGVLSRDELVELAKKMGMKLSSTSPPPGPHPVRLLGARVCTPT